MDARAVRPYQSSEILPVFMLIPHIPNLEIKQNREAPPLRRCIFFRHS